MRQAVITGAAGGIGRALVAGFSDAGYRVLATDHQPRPADLVCAHYLQADLAATVTDEAYAQAVFGQLLSMLGGPDLQVLVNNAAVQILGATSALSRADWRTTLNVNLVAPFLWTQALLPALEAGRGCVVNIGSIHARLTKPGFVAYATSKAALGGMTRAMAVDLGARIRINAIEPAAIETGMLKAGFAGRPDLYQQLEAAHPQGRIGQAEEVAALAVALAGDTMRFLHGACIGLDGGIGARLVDPV
jgi:NAD(P)-dependent dehydrogenase (short-subunit alcohol dehydrogenase family)